jgi:hypothetical protein
MWIAVRRMIDFRVPMSPEVVLGMTIAVVVGSVAMAYLLVLVLGR